MDPKWPTSLSHLSGPMGSISDRHVLLAEISSEPMKFFKGTRLLSTALVPLEVVDDVLANPGGIGWEVESWGPHPCVDPGQTYDAKFWIEGRGSVERFETLTPTWSRHIKRVVTISNGFLMCYGLIPRLSESPGEIFWDDPSGPNLGVVQIFPLAHYEMSTYSTAKVLVKRDYLEDYLSLKRCAAVGVFYEERYSTADQTFENLLEGEQHREFIEPGRRIVLQVTYDWGNGPQYSEVWGCALLLKPSSRPISDDSIGPLDWPDHAAFRPGASMFEFACIRSEVLQKFEDIPDYTIEPRSGGVDHGSWWGVSRCKRYGRNHLDVDLRKLYESVPSDVILHFHKFAVPREQAHTDRQRYGERHAGIRTDEIENFLSLVEELDTFLSLCGIGQSASNVSPKDVKNRGWWCMDEFRHLGRFAPITLPRDKFLGRCKDLYGIFEH